MLEFIKKTAETGITPMTTLTLPYALRQKSRQRVRLDNGLEAGLLLKRGGNLFHGDLLLSREQEVIQVLAAKEQLSSVRCEDHLLFARACYHLGNRHMPLQIEQGRLSYLHDHVLDAMLQGLGLQVEQIHAPFEPEAGAYGGGKGGHHHGH